MADSTVKDWEAVRLHLLKVAMRAGFDAADAADLAQDAIVATLQRSDVTHPVSYALVAMQRMMALRRRRERAARAATADWLLASWQPPLIPSVELISVSAAMEQLAVWGRQGGTRRMLMPDDDLDRMAADSVIQWEGVLQALQQIPVSERQRRRYRQQASQLLQQTIEEGRAGVLLLDRTQDAARLARIQEVLREFQVPPPAGVSGSPDSGDGSTTAPRSDTPPSMLGELASDFRLQRLVELIRSPRGG
jgi:DNA-directed RNA polymerase specialized sigma24 family protein